MKAPLSRLIAILLALPFVACGPKAGEHSEDDGHGDGTVEAREHGDHHDHGEEAAGARFVEGKGIMLLDETKNAIGLQLAEAEQRELVPAVSLEAQVYRGATEPSRSGGEQSGSAYATAFVGPPLAEKLKSGEPAVLETHDAEYKAVVWRVDPISKEAVNNVEVILQIPDPQGSLKVGEFMSGSVTESGAAATVVAIPRSAVLETATGKFAFVQNGDYLLRTPIVTGSESVDYVEIADGIYEGDIVVTHPVETLYLIELRATKGGGHSH